MMLYLVRHGEAVGADVDPNRPLSEEGQKEVLKIAHHLKKNNIQVDHIWHSSKDRAVQTAEMIADILERKELCQAHRGLNPNDEADFTADEVNEFAQTEDEREGLMIVGHLPHLERVGSYLITGNMSGHLIEFHTAGVACLHLDGKGKWSFTWGVYPDMIH